MGDHFCRISSILYRVCCRCHDFHCLPTAPRQGRVSLSLRSRAWGRLQIWIHENPDASQACPCHAGAAGAPAIRLLAAFVRRTSLLPEPPQPAWWKPPEQQEQAERIVDDNPEIRVDAHVMPPA